MRLPRTALGLLVGVALGLAGALMQALTRNPLADPGLLGVNAGAAAAVVTAIGLLGITQPEGYVWFSFLGAALASVLVYAIGSAGRGGATPVRLALAGTAITYALIAFVYGLALTDPLLLQKYNQWSVGSLGGRGSTELTVALPFVVLGALARRLPRAPAERARARRRSGARARHPRRPHADRRRGRDHAAGGRGDRRRRADRVRRPDRPARRARDRRHRPALGARLQRRARRGAACSSPTRSAACSRGPARCRPGS